MEINAQSRLYSETLKLKRTIRIKAKVTLSGEILLFQGGITKPDYLVLNDQLSLN